MLAASPSPSFRAAASKYSAPNLTTFSRRTSSNNTHYTLSPQASPKLTFQQSGSASPSLNKTRAPPPGYRSPKRPTADAGTQYTPPGLPPTARRNTAPSRRASRSPKSTAEIEATIAAERTSQAPTEAEVAPSEPPAEPKVRETPTSATAAAAATATVGSVRPVSPSATSRTSSSVKKARQEGGEITLLPLDYSQCEPKVLATLIACLLMDLIRHNDHIKLENEHLTRFHSRTPPGISVHDYLQRLTFHATLPTPVLLAMVNYIDKLCEAFPIFTINSLTVHRFLIAAATVAAKGLCDVFWTNSTYAKVGGVSKKELSILELELLTKTEWRIVPSTDKLEEYYKSVVESHPDYALNEPEPVLSPDSSTSSESIGTDTMDTE